MYYTVEDIIGKKITNGKVWYKVKWLGYDESDSTWQPPYTLEFAKQLIYDYQEAQGNQFNSSIFEDRDYGITEQDFYYENHQKSSRRKKKIGTKLAGGKPCLDFEDIVTPSGSFPKKDSSIIIKKEQCKVEQNSDCGDNYGQSNSEYSYNRYYEPSSTSNISCIENSIRIICKQPHKNSWGNIVYLVETGAKQIKQMTNNQLLKQHPTQFAKFLEETLYRKNQK